MAIQVSDIPTITEDGTMFKDVGFVMTTAGGLAMPADMVIMVILL